MVTDISDIIHLTKDFDKVAFKWIKRSPNVAAHKLANHARVQGLPATHILSMSVTLKHLLAADAAPY